MLKMGRGGKRPGAGTGAGTGTRNGVEQSGGYLCCLWTPRNCTFALSLTSIIIISYKNNNDINKFDNNIKA